MPKKNAPQSTKSTRKRVSPPKNPVADPFLLNNAFYRQLVESMEGYAVFTMDLDGKISSWNAGAHKLLGYSEKEAVGKNASVIFTPEDRAKKAPQKELTTAYTKGKALDERWHQKKDGTRFWASGLVFPLKEEKGTIIGFTKVMRDLTHKKQREIERQHLISIFENAPAFICILRGKEHRFSLANKLYYQLVGHRELIGKTVKEALPEVRGQGFIDILNKVYRTKKSYHGNEIKVSLQREKGDELEDRFVTFIYQPLFDNDQTVSGIFVHGVDVTDMVLARKKVEESEALFKTYTEVMPQMAFIADAKGNIIYYNQRWYDYVGIKGTEGWGWKDKLIHHPDDLERTTKRWKLSLRTGKPYEIEYRLRRHDGQFRWHLGRALPVRDNKGKIVQWLGTNTDIHDQKRAIEQKDEFLGIASHELKTPVTSIKAYAQVLEAMFRKKGEVKEAEHLQKLDSQINKLTNLIGDLLDVTKIQTGRLQFHEELFDFNELVHEVCEEIQRTTDKHKIIEKLVKTRTIFSDRERIGQVLTNLLTNAVKYSPHEGKIIIRTETDRKTITLCVQDFGVGIPEEKKHQVFEQFYRVSGPEQNTFPGLGLGLYISSEIIKREGGRIWVESTEGKGSTFCISLPLKKKRIKQQENYLVEEEIKHE